MPRITLAQMQRFTDTRTRLALELSQHAAILLLGMVGIFGQDQPPSAVLSGIAQMHQNTRFWGTKILMAFMRQL